MDKQELRKLIHDSHENGKKIAVSFCSHVPQEILLAAGFHSIRLSYVSGVEDQSAKILIRNVCPLVKNCCNVCESEVLDDVDLIIGETSCDGKKKLYELIRRQEQLYFYQVGQGADREYVKPLIKSESRYLVQELERRFGIEVSDEEIRSAGSLLNEERESLSELMEVQKTQPPAVWGKELYEAMEKNRLSADIASRIQSNRDTRERFLSKESSAPKSACRILITGCPLGGVYEKVISAVEENGGVVVCFENCETVKAAVRSFDTETEDVYEALAECYRNTSCAIMSPNTLRLRLLEELAKEYRVDGILDVTLQTCHPYTVEKYSLQRFCRDTLHIPCMTIETDDGDADRGQLATRITAFMEML